MTNIPDNNFTDRQAQAFKAVVDDILRVHDNGIIKRLRTMRNALTLEDPTPHFDIETLELAIQALGGRV
jgi:hypothetical protein